MYCSSVEILTRNSLVKRKLSHGKLFRQYFPFKKFDILHFSRNVPCSGFKIKNVYPPPKILGHGASDQNYRVNWKQIMLKIISSDLCLIFKLHQTHITCTWFKKSVNPWVYYWLWFALIFDAILCELNSVIQCNTVNSVENQQIKAIDPEQLMQTATCM